MSRRLPTPGRRRSASPVAKTGPTPETLAKLRPDLLHLLVVSGVIGEVDVEAMMENRLPPTAGCLPFNGSSTWRRSRNAAGSRYKNASSCVSWRRN